MGTTVHDHGAVSGPRFEFGSNWKRFLAGLTQDQIAEAGESLRCGLGMQSLGGQSFLDVGSGSGLFSLAAVWLGATVRSFDYDPESVRCTATLKRRYGVDDSTWRVDQGSVLDRSYVASLGTFDVVYSWGVLHHTGAMWEALENVLIPVAPHGTLFIAIYNDQGRASQMWLRIKRLYNSLPAALRFLVIGPVMVRLWGPKLILGALRGTPLRAWREYGADARGMSPWRDVIDWVGGYPFEVAKPEEVFAFCHRRGFTLEKLKTHAGHIGCNEYVFRRM
ncbi:MAG TPA: class I SAM-dependent methyltransferase [Ktedonobacterales bacterium]|nr:class I SAM-dependent methyltransferase [Ktedonobacterales bacterium]